MQVFVRNVTQDTQDAADIVFVVDESGSMTAEHEWLLVMVPLLENLLLESGMCTVNLIGSFGHLMWPLKDRANA